MAGKWRAAIGLALLGIVIPSTYGASQPVAPAPTYVLCDPPPADPCEGKRPCGVIADRIEILPESDGTFFVNGERVDQKKLIAYIKWWMRDDVLPIVVHARVDTPYGNVAALIATLRKNGVKKVACGYPFKLPPRKER